jgi:uncharacterized protein YdiU (UPF0061 family)
MVSSFKQNCSHSFTYMQQQNWQFQHSYAQLPSDFFELQQPTPVQNPKVLLLNNALVKDLGVDYLLEDEQ